MERGGEVFRPFMSNQPESTRPTKRTETRSIERLRKQKLAEFQVVLDFPRTNTWFGLRNRFSQFSENNLPLWRANLALSLGGQIGSPAKVNS